jgi:hypothetical protein
VVAQTFFVLITAASSELQLRNKLIKKCVTDLCNSCSRVSFQSFIPKITHPFECSRNCALLKSDGPK